MDPHRSKGFWCQKTSLTIDKFYLHQYQSIPMVTSQHSSSGNEVNSFGIQTSHALQRDTANTIKRRTPNLSLTEHNRWGHQEVFVKIQKTWIHKNVLHEGRSFINVNLARLGATTRARPASPLWTVRLLPTARTRSEILLVSCNCLNIHLIQG